MLKPYISDIRTISAEQLLERIPLIALPGEESAADMILFKIIEYLSEKTGADIGQINLLHMHAKLEKICIVKDGSLYLQKGLRVDGLDPTLGFTGIVLTTGKSLLVEDIWDENGNITPNPFLKLIPQIRNREYIEDIKRPCASTIILPIKRNGKIICTIELSRYRARQPFVIQDKIILDDFAEKYGSLIIDYLLDIKNRDSMNTAFRRLLNMSRHIASGRSINYIELIEPYSRMSVADFGLAFFRTGSIRETSYRMVAWHEREAEEIIITDFIPSNGSVLTDSREIIIPIEGGEGDERLTNFIRRIELLTDVEPEKKTLFLTLLQKVKSYVIYPLHMLNQELGVVILGSEKPSYCTYLHMNPLLFLYNSLLKSFLLNERLIHYLSDISLLVHNPGFYALGAVKTAILSSNPGGFSDNKDLNTAFNHLESLMTEIHERGRNVKWCKKQVQLSRWIRAFMQHKKEQFPMLRLNHNMNDGLSGCGNILSSDDQLDTIFENLFTNSIRAITARKAKEQSVCGEINVVLSETNDSVEIVFSDNGCKYKTVSGRGVSQIKEEMEALSGNMFVEEAPYKTILYFPRA